MPLLPAVAACEPQEPAVSELELPACADESAAVSSVLLELVSRKTTPTNITGELHFTEIVQILGNFYNFVQTALLCV